MSRGNTQPAVMMMPPHIRATFMPNPPLKQLPPVKSKRGKKITQGVFHLIDKFEKRAAPKRVIQPTSRSAKKRKAEARSKQLNEQRRSMIDEYRKFQRDCGGEFEGMNCYNTLFVGRLAFEVTEGKLLREMEAYGPVKDIKLVSNKQEKSRGIAFVEYENEEDMKRAYRAADGMKIEGREIVVDVERGHTVPTWLPRRLGGGLGGTRLGGKHQNVTAPGRFDPCRILDARRPTMSMSDTPQSISGLDPGPTPSGDYDRQPSGGGYGGGYGEFSRVGGDRDRRRRRLRSDSPDRGRYAPRSRY